MAQTENISKRAQLEALIHQAIELLDEIDAPSEDLELEPDLEPDVDAEDRPTQAIWPQRPCGAGPAFGGLFK